MDTPNPSSSWSSLPFDILISVLERLSFVDFHRSKLVCSNWYSCSKQTVIPRNSGSPWLMLFPADGGCVMYNPHEDVFWKKGDNFSENRFLANSGNWSLMLDLQSNLFVRDVFSEVTIILPPLVSLVSGTSALKRLGDMEFIWELTDEEEDGRVHVVKMCANDLRGRLWVDEKTNKLSVVWYLYPPRFNSPTHLCFYKSGDTCYTVIPLQERSIEKRFRGFSDLVLRGYRLYIYTTRDYVRVIDFSGQEGSFKDVSENKDFSPVGDSLDCSIAVTTAGEVLLIQSTTFENNRYFRLYKHDPLDSPDDHLTEVLSLGDEALLLDWGITVPANHALGIKPNCIYFTRHDRACIKEDTYEAICVFNLSTDSAAEKHTRFPALDNMNIKDARWFLPAG